MTTSDLWDDETAASYDADGWDMFDDAVLAPTIDVLAELAGDGRALEFAIGTGRVGLALSQRGVDVVGIELSQPMVDRLLAKPGADRVPVAIGDMATTRVDGTFRLVYLVYNTITNPLTQGEQVACFRNAAAHLEPGGVFLVEVFVPALQRLAPGDRFLPFDISAGHLGIDEYDVVNQLLTSHHYMIDGEHVRKGDSHHRYAWPAEYDLMAMIAGMTLRDRWSDWHRSAFTASSPSHISIWQKPV